MTVGAGTADGEAPWVGDVIRFWLEETPPEKRFKKDEALDSEIRARFEALYDRVAADPPDTAALTPRLALATLIVLDQFSRNMFRGSPKAFAADSVALSIARAAVAKGLDRQLETTERLFVYLPFEHSESLADQDQAVELIAGLGNAEWDRYAVAHRDIILRFGRFPHRNEVLGRASTAEELAFLEQPGSSF
ncbi:MAG: DUF924 family protein [Hyphomicrobiaceae bacterium]